MLLIPEYLTEMGMWTSAPRDNIWLCSQKSIYYFLKMETIQITINSERVNKVWHPPITEQ